MTRNEVLAWLKKQGTKRTRNGMARYGIVAKRAYGVSMGTMQAMSRKIGTDHELANALWKSGWYEGKQMAALVGDPDRVTTREMNAWVASCENWADVDTVCFKLWDRTPHAWEKARQWSASPREFVKRAGFVLMACLAAHDKTSPDKRFMAFLPLIERHAGDERNFVSKGLNWALRHIGRRSMALNRAAIAVAKRLAQSEDRAPRWVGKDALRELTNPKVQAALARKAANS